MRVRNLFVRNVRYIFTVVFRRKGSPEEFTEFLQKNIAVNKTYPTAHSVVQKEVEELARISNNRQAFLSKFEDLKQKK